MKRLEFGITDAMLEDVDEPIKRATQATINEFNKERQRSKVPLENPHLNDFPPHIEFVLTNKKPR